jgi:hypothetical protein
VTGPPNDGSRELGIEPGGPDPVVGEARWHMAGAVLAAMLLTLLLPSELRLGPRWLLPILEGALLVVLIVGDPGRISKRSSVLRGSSIALVTVLIAQSLWSTARLIDELIVGGPHTNKPGPLLAAAGTCGSRTTSRSRCSTGSSAAEGPQRERTGSPIIRTSRSHNR